VWHPKVAKASVVIKAASWQSFVFMLSSRLFEGFALHPACRMRPAMGQQENPPLATRGQTAASMLARHVAVTRLWATPDSSRSRRDRKRALYAPLTRRRRAFALRRAAPSSSRRSSGLPHPFGCDGAPVVADAGLLPSHARGVTVTRRKAGQIAVLALLSMTGCAGLAQRPSDERDLAASVDALAKPEATADRLSGIILIAGGDSIIVERTYGFADWELQVPNSPSTRFGVASITKVMTETLVDRLAGEGRLDLSAPVARYLVGFPDGPRGGHGTVRDLLTHRAGVPHRVTTALEEMEHLHPADIVERVVSKGLLFEPGTAELYSSAGFTCLARVVEIVENKPFDDVLAERIFRPGSMTSATGETGEQLMMNRARPYRLVAGVANVAVASVPYKDLSFLTGAGSAYATAEDLLHFVRALHGGKFGSVAQKQLETAADTAWASWYGRTNGYEGSVDFLPAQDLTFIFLSNLQSAANWQIRAQVRNILVGHRVAPITRPPPIAPSFESPATVVGMYGDAADPLVISEADGRLFRDENEFYPMAGGRYYLPVSGATMRFGRNSRGDVDSILTRFGDGPERALRRIGRE
jgi:CubicO group peptidase (beta-lactamase class C family)